MNSTLITKTDLQAIDIIRKAYADTLVGLKVVESANFVYDLFVFKRIGSVRVEVDMALGEVKEIMS